MVRSKILLFSFAHPAVGVLPVLQPAVRGRLGILVACTSFPSQQLCNMLVANAVSCSSCWCAAGDSVVSVLKTTRAITAKTVDQAKWPEQDVSADLRTEGQKRSTR